MKVHSLEKLKKLRELRIKGYSINELVRELSIPKTTVWHHVQGIFIESQYLDLLRKKIGGSKERKERNWALSKELAKNLLNSSYREYVVVLSMLYWAEGSKREFVFTNSDGRMVDLFIRTLVKVFNISQDRIIPTIRIFSGMDKKECLKYWSKITDLPENRFFVRINDGGIRSNTQYGLCRITLRKGSNTLKLIYSLINQFYEESIKLV